MLNEWNRFFSKRMRKAKICATARAVHRISFYYRLFGLRISYMRKKTHTQHLDPGIFFLQKKSSFNENVHAITVRTLIRRAK